MRRNPKDAAELVELLDGNAVIDMMAEVPILDKTFSDDPVDLTDEDFAELVRVIRAERAMSIKGGK